MLHFNTRCYIFALLFCAWAVHAEGQAPHWAELDSAFETCAKGLQQSPVDIRNTVKSELPKLEFGYTSAAPVIVNNGHTVQVNLLAVKESL